MTVGYPDFQAMPIWRGPTFASQALSITSVAPFNLNQITTNWASLYLNVVTNATFGMTATVKWFADAARTVLIDTFSWVLRDVRELSVIIPSIANYFTLTVSTAQAGTQTGSVFLSPANTPVPAVRYTTPGNRISSQSLTIPAGNTSTFRLPQIMEGAGVVGFNPQSGGANVDTWVEELDESGAVIGVLTRSHNPGGPITLPFQASVNPVQYKINNSDVNPHTYDFSINVLGR